MIYIEISQLKIPHIPIHGHLKICTINIVTCWGGRQHHSRASVAHFPTFTSHGRDSSRVRPFRTHNIFAYYGRNLPKRWNAWPKDSSGCVRLNQERVRTPYAEIHFIHFIDLQRPSLPSSGLVRNVSLSYLGRFISLSSWIRLAYIVTTMETCRSEETSPFYSDDHQHSFCGRPTCRHWDFLRS